MADALLGGIVINEVLVDPNSSTANFDTDGSGTAGATDEFVELVNTSSSAIDISGLQLWDAANGNWFTFPPGSVLAPEAHALVVAGVQPGGALPSAGPNDLTFDAGRGTAVLNNGGDNIVLYDPSSDTFIQATYNGDALDDPVTDYAGFSATASRSGAGEDFGTDIDGFSIQRAPDGADLFVNDETPTPATDNICFAAGTLILTDHGPVAVERLQLGDLVETQDNGLQAIKWIGRRRFSAADLAQSPNLRPVRIGTGALGPGMPGRELYVSPQHRLLACGKIVRRLYDCEEVLAAAKHLCALDSVGIAWDVESVTYFHIMFDRHEIVFAENLPSESLYDGDQALRSIDPVGLEELFSIFPELRHPETRKKMPPARRLLRGREARELARRHAKNRKPLLERVADAEVI
ncbi:MAG: Hint domain-containing protein [Pseudomonadota bacterium]